MAKKKKGKGLGLALGAAALASAGAYFLYGSKHAKQNRRQVKSWALKAKAEVLEQIEKAKELDVEQYRGIVDSVVARYRDVEGATKKEAARLADELKRYWKEFEKGSRAKKIPSKRRTK